MINVLIVEDDPMVAKFNKQYLEEIDGFHLVGIANSFDSAMEYIKTTVIDLILLDIYMAGKNGLELLKDIRDNELQNIDVILITAATDVDSIQTALRNGAVDYIIKPFEFERFHHSLATYKGKFHLLNKQGALNQDVLDSEIFHQREKRVSLLPKGLSKSTLQVIFNAMEELKGEAFSTDEVAEKSNISRVSVRKYLKFLNEIGVLGERMTYGPVGRPTYLYTYKKSNKSAISKFL
ncbi:two-component system response regulator DcuR [Salipaludibacillus neizhouensis]|uniref:Two-component system response regulator DcuR n=1 Tax=Salipaludibacillus neizhouensis TaxID=885475 RepID=A0A3A9K6W7_9BACI|nr:response regulator [Salipaludibacillus neizhouensis]RKL66252.1 two-component system response regulator DcuR [Salipaludibacillus neizhouensis]